MIRIKNGKKEFAWVTACSLLAVLVFFGLAVASEGGGSGGVPETGQMTDLLYRAVNFVLLVVILFFAIRKTAIKDFFADRREGIRKRFEDLKRGKEEAERRYAELEKRLKEFESQQAEILEQFKAEGLAEKERIIAQAEERAKQILAQADLTVQREFESAKSRLQAELLGIAAKKAQEIIVREIEDKDQDHLVREFIKKVETLH